MDLIIDENQFAYFEALPPDTRPGTLDDFHSSGIKHVNMPFLLLSRMTGHYVLYFVKERTTSGRLKFFIDLNQVYVFMTVPPCVTEYHAKMLAV